MSRPERIAADYRCVGLSVEGHPLASLRPELTAGGVLPASELKGCASGQRVAVAGLAICRQRPGTARGVMFVTLEDETGFANFVVMPDAGSRFRDRLMCPLLLLEGVVENEAGVVNVRLDGATALAPSAGGVRVRGRNFR